MDFSKIKKIFYIVAIISMLLSIKSKVFGAAFFYDVNRSNGEYTVDVSHFTNDLSNYKIFFSAKFLDTLGGQPRFNAFFICSDTDFTINDSNSNYGVFTFSNNQKHFYKTQTGIIGLSNLQSFIDNINPTLTTSNNFSMNFYYNDFANTTKETSDFYANFDIKNQNGETFIENTAMINPFFSNPQGLADAPDYVFIELGDYSANDYLYFHLLEVTNIMPMSNNDSTYYYNDHTFALNKKSKYYTQLFDTTKYYYSIPRSALGLNPDTSYFYVLTNSSTQIDNSINPITEGEGIYDVVMQDTTGIITQDMATNDKLQNINQEFNDYQQQQEEFQNQNSITTETETDIDSNLNFNNNAPQFSSLFNGFFSRLTSTISDLGNYQDTDVITVHFPIPYTNDTIPISSDFIFSNQNNNFLRNITTLLWYFIFGRYFLFFLIKTYWLITNGQFFKFYLTQKEAITSDML